MKYIILLIITFSFLYSDEISRIESIVNDITDLRKKYEKLQDEMIRKEINEKKQYEKIITLENQIKKYKKHLKDKEKEIKSIKSKPVKKVSKPKKVKPAICKPQKLEDPNKFPELVLKSKYIKYKYIKKKAKTYRLKKKAKVYDATYGKVIETWESDTVFTSNKRAVAKNQDDWVKVTGYFIKNSWIPATTSMWIKAKFVK